MLIVAICIALLCIKMLIQKNGKFPNIHVSGNKAMRERGIGCVQSQDREQQKNNPNAIAERKKSNDDLEGEEEKEEEENE